MLTQLQSRWVCHTPLLSAEELLSHYFPCQSPLTQLLSCFIIPPWTASSSFSRMKLPYHPSTTLCCGASMQPNHVRDAAR